MALYLLHFTPPYKHARHYLGYAENIEERIQRHINKQESPLIRAALGTGSTLTLARVWVEGDRNEERRLKKHSSTRYCPLCTHGALNRGLPK